MPSKCKMKTAFIWSSAVVTLSAILLLCSATQTSMIGLSTETAINRTTADRIQFLTYNLLFDLNQYLYQKIGEEAHLIANNGKPPNISIENEELDEWVYQVKKWMNKEGLDAEIHVTNLQFFTYTNSDRDLILLSALNLPANDAFYNEAINIDANLAIRLKNTLKNTLSESFFKIKSLNPIRLFGLWKTATELYNETKTNAPSWSSGDSLNEIAKNTETKFKNFIKPLKEKLTSQSYKTEIHYQITARKLNPAQCQIDFNLNKINITDLGKYSYAIIDSNRLRITYRFQNLNFNYNYQTKITSENINEVTITGIIE